METRKPHPPTKPRPKNPLDAKWLKWRPGESTMQHIRRVKKMREKHLEEPRR